MRNSESLLYLATNGDQQNPLKRLSKTMTNYNFIGIGINHYQYLPPLNHAQADINGLESFFREEARVSPDKTLTFTDNSPWIDEQTTYPTKRNLSEWLGRGFNGKRRENSPNRSSVLWFAFSGYGVQCNGEDYLLPVDAQLTDPERTGISVRELFTALQQQGAGKIIALLDMNRSTAVLGNGEVGENTLDLAGEMGIAAVLSCKPEEFSHETSALGHGMFTAGVLEALRYHRGELTLELLNNYLGDRLQELADHHSRPLQTPMMVIPSIAASRELILPSGEPQKLHSLMDIPIGAGAFAATQGIRLPAISHQNGRSPALPVLETTPNIAPDLSLEEPPTVTEGGIESNYDDSNDGESLPYFHDFDSQSLDEEQFMGDLDNSPDPTEPAVLPTTGNTVILNKDCQPWYLAGWQWLALLLLLLFGGLGWQMFQGRDSQPIITETPGDGTEAPGNTNTNTNVNPGNTNSGNTNPENGGTTVNPNGTPAGNGQTPNPSTVTGNNGTGTTPTTGTKPTPTATTPIKSAPTTPGSKPANNGTGTNSNTNSNTNSTIKPPAPTVKPATTPAKPANPVTNPQTVQAQNESVLTQANLVLRSSQASSFNEAIAAARSIKQGTPLYNEARTQINRWSRVILDIAEARAIKGDFSGAIAAAKLVPVDVPQVYGIAANFIKKWEKQLSSVQKYRQVIVNAQELIIPYQASSYSRAIAAIKKIQPSEPVYAEARRLQDQWSRTIYLLANSRAAQGRFKLAVQTAKLVPADSPSYKASQGAIARWQKGVR